MKAIAIIFMILVSLIKAGSTVLVGSENITVTQSQTSQASGDATSPLQLDGNRHVPQDCDDNSSSGHQCHLGHCGFVVAPSFLLWLPSLVMSSDFIRLSLPHSADLSSEKKPPKT